MTKLKACMEQYNLDPVEVARLARVTPKDFEAYMDGKTPSTRARMTYITQAIRGLIRTQITVRDLFDVPPPDMNF